MISRSGTIILAVAALISVASCSSAPITTPTPSVSSSSPSPDGPTLESRFLFATKTGTRVRVFAVDLGTGDRDVLLRYEEEHEADSESGNYYALLGPSVTLSADGRVLAYAAADGLHVFEPATGTFTTLVRRTAEGDAEQGEPAAWDPALKDVYSLTMPTVSSDAAFVSVQLGHYEGSDLAMFSVDGELLDADLVHVEHPESASNVSWAATAPRWVVARRGFFMKPGWFLSDPDDVPASRFVRSDLGVEINDASLSPDGARVTLITNPGDAEPDTVWVARADGTDARAIDGNGIKGGARFDPDGDLWWIENDFRAGRLHRQGAEQSELALDHRYRWEFVGWLDVGLALAGYGPSRRGARLLVLDPESLSEVARYDSASRFTTFLGTADVSIPA